MNYEKQLEALDISEQLARAVSCAQRNQDEFADASVFDLLEDWKPTLGEPDLAELADTLHEMGKQLRWVNARAEGRLVD